MIGVNGLGRAIETGGPTHVVMNQRSRRYRHFRDAEPDHSQHSSCHYRSSQCVQLYKRISVATRFSSLSMRNRRIFFYLQASSGLDMPVFWRRVRSE